MTRAGHRDHGYWNHNVHYQPVILGAVPAPCARALEVGCGDGLLARRLAERCAEVTAIDRDARMIALARQRTAAGRITFVEADYLTCPVAGESFDFACANTSLHHMDFQQALAAMARALRPGGRLAVVGLAASGSAGDYLGRGPRGRPPPAPRRALPPPPAVALLAALDETLGADIGGGAAGDADEFGVGGGEDGVRVACRRPDLVVLVQPGVRPGPPRRWPGPSRYGPNGRRPAAPPRHRSARPPYPCPRGGRRWS